jgi:hypothetical protein
MISYACTFVSTVYDVTTPPLKDPDATAFGVPAEQHTHESTPAAESSKYTPFAGVVVAVVVKAPHRRVFNATATVDTRIAARKRWAWAKRNRAERVDWNWP